jgi:hypothetical protein
MLEQLLEGAKGVAKSPYALPAALGVGALGLGGLGYAMSRRGKKKREEEDGEYEPKFAQVIRNNNWYKLARQKQQKQANGSTYSYGMGPASASAQANPQATGRTLYDWLDDTNNDRTFLGFKKNPERLRHDARVMANPANSASKLKVDAIKSPATAATVNEVSPSLLSQLATQLSSAKDNVMNYKYTPHIAAGGLGLAALGAGAYMGGRESKKKKKPQLKAANFKLNLDSLNAGSGAGLGAIAGGGLGAMYGALAPGYEEDPDTGRRKRRSRLTAALRGLAGGVVAGGGIGGGIGYAFGPQANKYMAMRKLDAAARENAGPKPEVMNGLGGDVDLNEQGKNVNFKTQPNMGVANPALTPVPDWAQPDIPGADLARPETLSPRRVSTPTPAVGMGGATMGGPNLASR